MVVDLDLTPNQELFVQTSARFIESACPLTTVRDLATGDGDPGPEYRRQAAELGWFAMLVPEDRGGGSVSDNGVYDAALIAYERGGALQPGGFVGTNVVAYALAAGGSEDHQAKVLPTLVAGETTATWAVTGSRSDASPTAGVRAVPRSGNWVLSGTKTFVVDPARSEWILVSAAGDNGPVQALVRSDASGVSIRPLEGLDITRRFGEVQLDEVEVSQSALVGTPETTAALLDKQLQIACVLTVAESVGAMNRDLNLAVDYAKARTAFGRPIGSFQAIKHLLADTSLMLEMSKAMAARGRRSRRGRARRGSRGGQHGQGVRG